MLKKNCCGLGVAVYFMALLALTVLGWMAWHEVAHLDSIYHKAATEALASKQVGEREWNACQKMGRGKEYQSGFQNCTLAWTEYTIDVGEVALRAVWTDVKAHASWMNLLGLCDPDGDPAGCRSLLQSGLHHWSQIGTINSTGAVIFLVVVVVYVIGPLVSARAWKIQAETVAILERHQSNSAISKQLTNTLQNINEHVGSVIKASAPLPDNNSDDGTEMTTFEAKVDSNDPNKPMPIWDTPGCAARGYALDQHPQYPTLVSGPPKPKPRLNMNGDAITV